MTSRKRGIEQTLTTDFFMQLSPSHGLPQRERKKRRTRIQSTDAQVDQEQGEDEINEAVEKSEPNCADPMEVVDSSGNGNGNENEMGDCEKINEFDVPEYRSQTVENFQFEYLDHTADVQIHGWGKDLSVAFSQAALGVFNYMTPLSGITSSVAECTIEAEGHDMTSLLFSFLDEFLFVFHTEFIVCKEIEVLEFDRENWKIKAKGSGEKFSRERHACGTEVKAITYSAMQINEKEGDAEVFVIVDI